MAGRRVEHQGDRRPAGASAEGWLEARERVYVDERECVWMGESMWEGGETHGTGTDSDVVDPSSHASPVAAWRRPQALANGVTGIRCVPQQLPFSLLVVARPRPWLSEVPSSRSGAQGKGRGKGKEKKREKEKNAGWGPNGSSMHSTDGL